MNRRHFLTASIAAALSSLPGQEKKTRRIILRSSWQTVNIGDIAHTPGVLHLLEQHLPDVEVRLWPSKVNNGVEEMLMKRFPKLKILKTPEEIRTAFVECDFLLHGSGPSLVGAKDVIKWAKETGKPYGIYSITFSETDSVATKPASSGVISQTIQIFNDAKFVYFRDSVSLDLAKKKGCTCPILDFCPEGSFAVDLRNDAAAASFLKEHDLEEGKFLCCIPRYRFTPYWVLPEKNAGFDEKKNARNEEMKEHDLAPLREAIIAIARETKMKVLVCPEDATQMVIGKEMLVDKLPKDVKPRVVWRPTYWLTDEALSTYVKSAGLFGAEMHSPIMCIGNCIPAIVCRWKEQTSKGLMWRDIGLSEWLFDMDVPEEVLKIVPTVLAMAKDPAAAKAKAAKALEYIHGRQIETMTVVGKYA